MATYSITMLVCDDVARSRDFYRDVLGLKVGFDQPPNWVDFELGGGARLGLHPKGEGLAVEPGSMSIGFDVEDVDGFVRDVKGKGVRVLREPSDEDFGRLAILGDPDGYAVQVITRRTAW